MLLDDSLTPPKKTIVKIEPLLPPLLGGLVNMGIDRLKIRVALTSWGDRGRTNTTWPLNKPHLGLLASIRVR